MNKLQSSPQENARARRDVRAMIDAAVRALSQRYENQELCFRALMLKMLVEDLHALDHNATFQYLRGVHDQLCALPDDQSQIDKAIARQMLALDLLADFEIARQATNDGRPS